ncbi:hypothetical protein LCGC14_2367390, partial [marine sediment metagenome]
MVIIKQKDIQNKTSTSPVIVKPKPLSEVPGFKRPEGSILDIKPKTPTGEVDIGVSVEDYLVSIGQPGDLQSRVKIARDLGITNYIGNEEQNLRMLRLLREGQQAEEEKPEVKPTVEPTIKTPGQQEIEQQQDTQQQIVDLNKDAEEEQQGEY